MTTATTDKNRISIHYADQETGWAERLENGTYRICNVPLVATLNVDDIVTLKDGNPECCTRPVVDKVLSSRYSHKVIVCYRPTARGDYRGHYKKLSTAVSSIGGECAGFSPGFAGVAVSNLGTLQEKLDTLKFKTEIEYADPMTPGEA